MSDIKCKIGDHFLHIPNNGPPKCLIYTKSGYLPNDVKAEKIAWKSGFACDNGMNNCMTAKQFSVWWASQIEKKYKSQSKDRSKNKSKSKSKSKRKNY